MSNPTILIKGTIRPGFTFRLREILAQYPQHHIEVFVDSGGGDACEGLAMAYNLKKFRKDGGEITAIAIHASSAASFITAVADHRLIVPEGHMMIHSVAGSDDVELIDAFNRRLSALYNERSLIPQSMRNILESRTDVMFNAEQAVANGLCDLIMTSPTRDRNYDHSIIGA